MKHITGSDFQLNNTCVTLGKFDGIHTGHRLLMKKVMEAAGDDLESVVFTFQYHPAGLFSKKEPELIYTEEEKITIFESLMPDVMISYPFTRETASMEPEVFIREIIAGKLNARAVVVGEDFRFGKNRSGTIETFKKFQEEFGFKLFALPKMIYKDEEISSTRIRNEIKAGNMEEVNVMLGEPYFILGEVLHGKKIGRQMDFRTANLIPGYGKLLPPNGVYATKVLCDGKEYLSVTNIGVNPTISKGNSITIESHLLDHYVEMYGKTIKVELHHYIRPELTFETLDELKVQIQDDIVITKQYFHC